MSRSSPKVPSSLCGFGPALVMVSTIAVIGSSSSRNEREVTAGSTTAAEAESESIFGSVSSAFDMTVLAAVGGSNRPADAAGAEVGEVTAAVAGAE